MNSIDLQEVLRRLGPNYPNLEIGIGVYLICAFALLNLFMQKKPDTRITLMLSAVILLALMDKVVVSPGGPIYNRDIEAFFLRVPMFVFPLITAGMTRWDRARPWGVIGGFIGGVYLFLRWFFEQQV
ncbi:MAG: hypothetical protein KF726_09275 [Anaerolineae bacterium]|nr:hypothetical protein [Anaerolineae bacterium]